jgi:hypothetical protein
MSSHRVTLALLTLVLGLAVFGCEPAPPEALTNPESTETREESAQQTEGIDPAVLQGRWVVETTLTDIDNDEFWFLGDKPSAQWECAVNGAAMQMQTADNLYSGVVKSDGDDWVYEGLASYKDEDGATWTSTIVVRATQDGEDNFTGEMEGSIDSDADGHLYTGTWELVGQRME